MQVSIADVQLYMHCPRAYKLHKIDSIEPSRKTLSLCKASAVRQVIAALHGKGNCLHDIAPEEIGRLCDTVWQSEVADPQVDQEEIATIAVQAKLATKKKVATEAITKGQRCLDEVKTWCRNYALFEENPKVLYSNVYFEDRIGDVVLSGYIDQIREHGDGDIQIVSFKSSAQVPGLPYLVRDFATSLYAHAIWQGKLYPRYPDVQAGVELRTIPANYCYYLPYLEQYRRKTAKNDKGDLKGNPMLPAYRDQETLLEFEYEVLNVVAGIELGYFPMHVVSPCGCAICQFTDVCDSAASREKYPECPDYIESLVKENEL